jgi:hypothetical protein
MMSKTAKIIRWVARVWSILVLAIAVVVMLPDLSSTKEAIPAKDILMLSLWGVAILGLLLAWVWERLGVFITIVTLFIREIVWVALYGNWTVNFLIFWALVLPPALLFWIASSLDRKQKSALTTINGSI